MIGTNSRLSPIQAAVLTVKLKYLDEWNKRRENIAQFYNTSINSSFISPVQIDQQCISSRHLYVVKCSNRDHLSKYLHSNGIPTLIHYPIPPHRQKAYRSDNQHHLPVADNLSSSVLSLPIGPHLPITDAEKIVASVNLYNPNYV